MYYYYDYSWFVLLPAIIFTMICQARINRAYRTYSQVPCSTGVTGAEAARAMMDAGIVPSESQLEAMGWTPEQYWVYRMANGG